jgi:hypothetical protein
MGPDDVVIPGFGYRLLRQYKRSFAIAYVTMHRASKSICHTNSSDSFSGRREGIFEADVQ